jgi:uncharacterized protein YbcI
MSTQPTSPRQSIPIDSRRSGPAVTISNQMVRLLARYVGRGPTKARTTLAQNLVVVTFGETMTRAELNLVAAGKAEAVASMRRVFQATMREEAESLIEETLGRTVTAYLADIDTDANVALVAFVLSSRDGAIGEDASRDGATGGDASRDGATGGDASRDGGDPLL